MARNIPTSIRHKGQISVIIATEAVNDIERKYPGIARKHILEDPKLPKKGTREEKAMALIEGSMRINQILFPGSMATIIMSRMPMAPSPAPSSASKLEETQRLIGGLQKEIAELYPSSPDGTRCITDAEIADLQRKYNDLNPDLVKKVVEKYIQKP